jgi:hypothetical protein
MRFSEEEREAVEQGYVACFCGEWAVGLHSDCRWLMTEKQIEQWEKRESLRVERILG